jgi:hypothetical protein
VLLAPVLLVTIVSALGWGITRFRHAAEVSIVILAASALSALYDRHGRIRWPSRDRPASLARRDALWPSSSSPKEPWCGISASRSYFFQDDFVSLFHASTADLTPAG